LKRLLASLILKFMLKAYTWGFFSAALAVLLVAAIWLGTQSRQDYALLWGAKVYTSKQEFKGYLKAKGLSYRVWAARYPKAAEPWEPNEVRIGAITLRASTSTRDAWVIRLPLVALTLMLAVGATLLVLRPLRSAMPSAGTRSLAFASAVVTVLLVTAIWLSA
jgi:hypothetical protein